MESITKENKDVDHGWRSRIYRSLCYLGLALGVIGCTTIKKAGVTALATGAGVTAATVLSSGATAPILVGTTTAFVADAATEVMMSDKKKGVILKTEQGVIECAPDNIWSLLEKLVGVGGWFLILLFVVPMLLGWILPGPLTTHGKKRKERNLFS